MNDRVIDLALTVLAPVTAAIIKKRMQLHEAIALSKEPEAIQAVNDIALDLILRMVDGEEIGLQARLLIAEWAERQQKLRRRGRKRGRRRERAKELAVYFSYCQKLKADPEAKKEAIRRELESEFGLERRHVLGIIRRVGLWAKSSPRHVKLIQDLFAPPLR
jgi:hypothetical protein